MTTPRESGRRAARAGTTLVELLIALVVLGLVSSALTTAIVRQQRANARTVAAVGMRNQGRITLAALAAELRGVSAAGGDINPAAAAGEMTATTLTVRVPIGASVICHIEGDRTHFSIPPTGVLTGDKVLTGFLDPDNSQLPDENDLLFAFDPSAPTATPWFQSNLANRIENKGSGSCPSGAGTLLSAAEADGDYRVTAAAALPANVIVGSPVRFVRVVRYSFAQDAAGDGQWYLWYQRCSLAGVCSAAAPVTGPFLPTTADKATTGFRFRYYDSAGAETVDRLAVARIDIFARPTTREKVSVGSSSRTTLTPKTIDSVTVALRNRY